MNCHRIAKCAPVTLSLGLLVAALAADAAPGGRGGGKPGDGGSAPTLEFISDKADYVAGETAVLSWSSSGTKFCSASDDWTGKLPTSGSYTTAPLDGPHQYTLKCNARGGGVEQTLALSVSDPVATEPPPPTDPDPVPAPDPVPEPTLTLTASSTAVDSGGSVSLTWTTSNASTCTASGGWYGEKPASGAETVGPISSGTGFSLTCTGDGGSVLATVQVDTVSLVNVSWQPPSENVDGTPLTDLSGFRIYYGEDSRAYSQTLTVDDAAAVSHTLALSTGSYYVAMTAIDGDGNESAFSNEVLKTAP
jgi:hypothetical protein